MFFQNTGNFLKRKDVKAQRIFWTQRRRDTEVLFKRKDAKPAKDFLWVQKSLCLCVQKNPLRLCVFAFKKYAAVAVNGPYDILRIGAAIGTEDAYVQAV